MPLVLSYASPEAPQLRRYLGPIAIVVAICCSTLVVAATFYTRYALASHVQIGWCGTGRASLELQLYMLPAMLFVPGAVAAGLADHLHYCPSASRISICVAVLGWAARAFVG